MSANLNTELLASPPVSAGRISSLPILVLNAHSRCNCRCVMCDIWKRDESTEITAIDLQRHRDSLLRLGVQHVVLSGGEPLMHSDLAGLCNFLRELNIRLTLLTTGLLLSRRSQDVVRFFDDVIVSLDGPEEIHDSIRRVKGGYQAISSGVAAVRELRPNIRVTARTTVQKANYTHLQRGVRAAKALRLDGISFLAADLTSEAFNRPLVWPGERQNEVGLSRSDNEILEREVEDLIKHFAGDISSGYIAESPSKLRKIVAHFRAHIGEGPHISPRCNAPWVSAVIEADGSVRPCFFHRPFGQIGHTTLEEILNGEEARSFRANLRVSDNPVCQSCVCSLYRPE